MYNLFNLMSTAGQGVLKLPEWLYIRDGLKQNLGTVIRFYRKNPMAVPSSHFLVRLLQSIAIPQSHNLERYYDNVDAIALNLSMSLKMTSSIYRGYLFKGVFYGEGSSEILMAHNESFNIEEANRNWQNLCPVRVLRHPKSDLGLSLPDGRRSGSETGLAVISINIPMLAIQYRAFRMNEIQKSEDNPESQRSVMQFIHMYVLPNMLFSHLDVALFNRLDNHRKGAPLGEATRDHSFYLTDYSRRVDAAQLTLLHNLHQVSKDFTGILRSIPLVSKDNLEQLQPLPEIAPTRQALWGLVISRLPVLSFLFHVMEEGPGIKNRSDVNKVMRSVQAYRSDNLMRNILPIDLYFDISDEIESIVNATL